ncbi:hypothetical protein [Anatilimnocola floriformis]|uniref:hypothetical protein n=1 Tax=Anatilimnocola floriformis TaxID=2948575 RepID=UPI0020C42D94|nr:hypothetical protein [Anatilimnocola floriformis]
MSQPNPFADEPLPTGQRLQSAADPLDPYAAPAGGAEYEVQHAGPGPGVWRQGDLVVVHQSLNLPERCIWTNEPTKRRFTVRFTYYTWLGLRGWQLDFAYSFSRTALWRMMRKVLTGLAMFTGSVGANAGIITLESYNYFQFDWLAPLFVITAIVGCMLAYRASREPLSLVYHEQGYFCLRGAKEPFLESLPNWPGLHR